MYKKEFNFKIQKLNLNTIEDIITYYPFRYNEIKNINISELTKDSDIAICAVIFSFPLIKRIKKMTIMEFSLNYENRIIKAVIFNREFLKSKIIPNERIIIFGKYNIKQKKIVISNIEFTNLDVKIQPVYSLTEGITNKQITSLVKEALVSYEVEESYIPKKLCDKYRLISKKEALKNIHFPNSMSDVVQAKRRLKYEECFVFFIKLLALKKDNIVVKAQKYGEYVEDLENFINSLPFNLTDSQNDALKDILSDLDNTLPMNRLLQGDVGSGKTVIAAIAMLKCVFSNYQCVLMSPTELLAKQHFNTLKEMFSNYDFEMTLLTGSQKNKKNIYENIENGKIKIIVGTHAVFQKDVIYQNLSLVITDEQHRFGVNQRKELREKAVYPDILFLSATPIPRSLFLTILGDIDVTNISTVPTGRKKIITKIIDSKKEGEIFLKVEKELNKKRQVYIVAPLIEESEKSDLENITNLLDKYKLQFENRSIKVLHGKMKDNEKEEIMNQFHNHEIDILIATTVIEVGIDVKNATLIVIYEASRFGIATLHQLRGRVGRSSVQSYCLLVTSEKTQRLKIIRESNDGFYLAEEDLKLRGPGDFFGEKQSGELPFKITDLVKDEIMINLAKQDAFEYIESNQIQTNKILNSIYTEILKVNINA